LWVIESATGRLHASAKSAVGLKTRRASERRYGCFRQLRTLVGQSVAGPPLWATTAGKLMAQAATAALDSHRAATGAQGIVTAVKGWARPLT
jgi:hypothetical protein